MDLPVGRAMWVVNLDAPAVVLGSTQADSDVDPDAATALGLQVARRRSGGGLVWLDPDATTWIDVTVTPDDPMWSRDVVTSSLWLGRVFADALAAGEGDERPAVWDGVYEAGEYGRSLCFAGRAPGEVFMAGGKLVGISQRRSRDMARFQCVVHHRWDPDRFARVFADPAVRTAAGELAVAETHLSHAGVVAAVLAHLPA